MTSAQGASTHAAPAARAAGGTGSRGAVLVGVGVALLGLAGFLAWRNLGGHSWVQGYRVVKTFPHDPTSYTQGLVFADGILYESTGQRGFSKVRTVKVETGEVLKETELPPSYFGEGLALVGDRLIQLTWEEEVARVYDRATLEPLDQFEYEGEGWGLAYDGTHLVMSNGSELLTFRDPKTFKEVRRVRVSDGGRPVLFLNELEVVEGEIWANVWKKSHLVRIDPRTGKVLGYVDLTGIFDTRSIPNPDAVLNGIAWDAAGKRLFVTGKLWPKLFQIEVVDQ